MIRTALTATAIAVAYVAGHGYIGLLAVLAYVWASAIVSTAGTAKTRNTENRLNAAMPRIPWPQANPGASYNSSYPPGNVSYTSGNTSYSSGNYSYPTGAGVSGSDTTWSSNQGSGTVNPWPHAHTIGHSHNLGSFQSDFNNLRASYSDTVTMVNTLRDSYSNTVSAFNNHIGDHGNLVSSVQAIRASYSQMVTDHNHLVDVLASANILH